jgi:hypothetical protein
MSWRIPWIRIPESRIPGIYYVTYVLRHRYRDTISLLGLDRPDRLEIQVRNIARNSKLPFLLIMTTHRKRKENSSLAARVDFVGVEMSPCSYCEKRELTCVVSPDSLKCSEYIRLKRKYNVEGPSTSDWQAIDTLKERLEHKTEETLQVIVAVAAKLACLQKQQRLLRTCAQEMLRQGFKTLDELEEAEAKGKEEREVQERAAVNSAALADSSWLEPLSDKQLNQLLLDFPESTAELQPSY